MRLFESSSRRTPSTRLGGRRSARRRAGRCRPSEGGSRTVGPDLVSSPGSGLLFSVVLRPSVPPDRLGLLTTASGLGSARGIERAASCRFVSSGPTTSSSTTRRSAASWSKRSSALRAARCGHRRRHQPRAAGRRSAGRARRHDHLTRRARAQPVASRPRRERPSSQECSPRSNGHSIPSPMATVDRGVLGPRRRGRSARARPRDGRFDDHRDGTRARAHWGLETRGRRLGSNIEVAEIERLRPEEP